MAQFIAPQHCDTVEWHQREDLLIAGCYQLDESTKCRRGSLLLMRYEEIERKLIEVECLDLNAGVLDCRWHYTKDDERTSLLATATADCSCPLIVYAFDGESSLSECCKFSKDAELDVGFGLSCEWCRCCSTAAGARIVLSDSSGGVSLFAVDGRGNEIIRVAHHREVHGHETWTAAMNSTDHNIYYSGGDDSKLCWYDQRVNSGGPVSSNSRSHTAGVTCILHSEEFHLITGCYDEIIRNWDLRNMKSPRGEVAAGGGVWRIKWNRDKSWMAAALMYGGFGLIPGRSMASDLCAEREESIPAGGDRIVFGNIGCERLAYGVSWSENGTKLAACSFYDNTITVSHFNDLVRY